MSDIFSGLLFETRCISLLMQLGAAKSIMIRLNTQLPQNDLHSDTSHYGLLPGVPKKRTPWFILTITSVSMDQF